MASFQNAYYTCSCPAEKCDRDCFSYRYMTHTESRADRIRAMSDEELAEWLSCNCTGDGYGNSAEDWLNWLKEEYKE